MRRVCMVVGCLAILSSGYVGAESASSYCNEMYPADSYEPAERGEYIRDCMEAYGETDDSSSQVSEEVYTETQPTQSEPMEYNDGTVEDYVDTVTESNDYE